MNRPFYLETLIFSFFRSPPYDGNDGMVVDDIDLSFIDVRDILNLDANFQPINESTANLGPTPTLLQQQPHQPPQGPF